MNLIDIWTTLEDQNIDRKWNAEYLPYDVNIAF